VGPAPAAIGKLGLAAAILMLIILIIKYLAQSAVNGWADGSTIAGDIVGFFITAVTIVVVAVPEGLPMAVALALAYATIQMLKDQNLVRVLAACETMGGATSTRHRQRLCVPVCMDASHIGKGLRVNSA
jgi:P-type Ca2+ transporter type 2C